MPHPASRTPWRQAGALVHRLEQLLTRWEGPPPLNNATFSRHAVFRWHPAPHPGGSGHLEPIGRPHRVELEQLLGIDHAKAVLLRNTAQFAAGLPANNALLWGSRGTGKSSLVKAVAARFAPRGLKLVEVQPAELIHLPAIVAQLGCRPNPCLLFCDDLSFGADDPAYKELKAVLEGGVEARPANILLYATSNRRHLMPRHFEPDGPGELHPGESVEERISLSDRFGLWLGFHPFDQATYLAIVSHYAQALELEVEPAELTRRALAWSQERGARSGRVAWQFVTDLAGALATPPTPQPPPHG